MAATSIEHATPTRREYLRLVLLGGAIGIPAAAVAALFLAVVHYLEEWLWTDLPDALGASSPPWYLVLGLPALGAAMSSSCASCFPGTAGISRSRGSP